MENETYSDLLEKAYAGNVDAAYELMAIMSSFLGTHAEALRQLGDKVPLSARIPPALCEYFEEAFREISGCANNALPALPGFYSNLAMVVDRGRNRKDAALALRIKREAVKGRLKRDRGLRVSAVKKLWERHGRRDLTADGLGIMVSTSLHDLLAELRQQPPIAQKMVSLFAVPAANNQRVFCALVPTK